MFDPSPRCVTAFMDGSKVTITKQAITVVSETIPSYNVVLCICKVYSFLHALSLNNAIKCSPFSLIFLLEIALRKRCQWANIEPAVTGKHVLPHSTVGLYLSQFLPIQFFSFLSCHVLFSRQIAFLRSGDKQQATCC